MSVKEIYGYGRGNKDLIKKQEYELLHQNKELSAKEMFEKLNYFLGLEKFFLHKIVYYLKDSNDYILFNKLDKTIDVSLNHKPLTTEELQAINKQVEELGWLDE